jgi:hypothetical protein
MRRWDPLNYILLDHPELKEKRVGNEEYYRLFTEPPDDEASKYLKPYELNIKDDNYAGSAFSSFMQTISQTESI